MSLCGARALETRYFVFLLIAVAIGAWLAWDAREFKQAARALADPAVPLDVVLQYAHGANWGLSCTAFAALARRNDRSEALDQVVTQFDRVAPWAMYFALEYFLTAEPRPPVGAAV